MDVPVYSAVVVGAGVAGLLAARELSKDLSDVLVLEASDRIGGRVQEVLPVPCPLRGLNAGTVRYSSSSVISALPMQLRMAGVRPGVMAGSRRAGVHSRREEHFSGTCPQPHLTQLALTSAAVTYIDKASC